MDKIKPVAFFRGECEGDTWFYAWTTQCASAQAPLYDQSAIDALRADIERLRAALHRLLGWAEEIAGDNCDPEAAAEEIASVELARSAMQVDAQ